MSVLGESHVCDPLLNSNLYPLTLALEYVALTLLSELSDMDLRIRFAGTIVWKAHKAKKQ